MRKPSRVINTPHYSKRIGALAKGCELCVKGRKLVLFVTGLCSKRCWYCPLSEQKKNKDVVYANEWPTDRIKNIIKEAELCCSLGAGITGGDPFLRINRAVSYIKTLKRRFGKKFHIHLYAPLEMITQKKLEMLYSAGLDEMRVHPDFASKRHWNKIALINRFNWDVGVEIPAIPGMEEQIKDVVDFFSPHIRFLNINELEVSETNMDEMVKHGFKPKDRTSYGVKGSEALALKIMTHCASKKINVHYCTTKLKDAVQLARRIKLRAKSVKEDFDCVDSEGLMTRGAIYLPTLKPGFGYRRKIKETVNKEQLKNKLSSVRKKLISEFNIPPNLIKVDEDKLRLLTSALVANELAEEIKEMGLVPAIVKEYPTHDAFEVTVEFV